MADCVFCKIVAKQIPATVVHEDEHTLAFMDIGQVNPGHVLVAAKAHVENLYGLEPAQAFLLGHGHWPGRCLLIALRTLCVEELE